MQGDNVETVRTWIARFNSEDGAFRDSVAEFWDAEADYYPVRKFPDAEPCHGVDEIAAFFASYRESWDHYETGGLEIVPVADDRVLARTTIKAEGIGAGLTVEGLIYTCVWLRHGRILRCEDHLSETGAVRALGLDVASFGEVRAGLSSDL